MLIHNTELFYYKYNSKNNKITAEFINNLIHKYGIELNIFNITSLLDENFTNFSHIL